MNLLLLSRWWLRLSGSDFSLSLSLALSLSVSHSLSVLYYPATMLNCKSPCLMKDNSDLRNVCVCSCLDVCVGVYKCVFLSRCVCVCVFWDTVILFLCLRMTFWFKYKNMCFRVWVCLCIVWDFGVVFIGISMCTSLSENISGYDSTYSMYMLQQNTLQLPNVSVYSGETKCHRETPWLLLRLNILCTCCFASRVAS